MLTGPTAARLLFMCELFGLSRRHPDSLRHTPLGEFRLRGGQTADNPDGWGIAWHEQAGFQLRKAPELGADSADFAALIDSLHTELLLAHVRKANHPPINTLNNTHPFLHNCCDRHWAFAHNGIVPSIVALELANAERVCHPAGETDSEFAFCHLLSHVSQHGRVADGAADWLDKLGGISESIAHHGKFNFLLSDGEYLIAYGHDRLHYREAVDRTQATVWVATEPLGNVADWIPFEPGELRIYRAGIRVADMVTYPPTPLGWSAETASDVGREVDKQG